VRAALQNKTVQEGLAVLLAGLALGAYSLISFYTGAVHVVWILSPWLFPLLLSVFAVVLGAALVCGGCRETAQSRSAAPAAPDRSGRKRALAVVLMVAVSISLRARAAGSEPSPAAFSSRSRSLSFIFCAASRVKVITRNWETDASGFWISVSLIFSTMTVVFPEPAAAETRMFWFWALMASNWEALNFVGTGEPPFIRIMYMGQLYHESLCF